MLVICRSQLTGICVVVHSWGESVSKGHWQSVYDSGGQLNRYPYDFVVSSFFRFCQPTDSAGSNLNVLDLGCGAGNHSIFCAENGHRVMAVDTSPTALEVLRERARAQQLDDLISTGIVDFEELSFDIADRFDCVIDRLSTTHVGKRYARALYRKLHEVLTPRGTVIANFFSANHSSKETAKFDAIKDVWMQFDDPEFAKLGSAYFYELADITDIFSEFELVSLTRTTTEDALHSTHRFEQWNVVATK